jgi:signal transduction histidine kinase/DNA-binding response OmpR family regulator
MPSSVLHGSAVKVLSSGVVVKLEDGREGFLPRREFTNLPTRDLRQVVKPGDAFEVIPEEYVPAPGDETANRILLHRVSSDSWEQLTVGSVVTGVVAGIEPYGVFVDLLPGITGLVARAELAHAAIKRIEDVMWVGDVVRCQILSIDRAAKRVALSVKAAAAARQALLQDGLRPELAAPPASTPAAAVLSVARQDLPALKILVVDDGDDLREELADHLEHFGHAVEQAATASAARAALDGQSFDVAVIDIGLPDQSGLDLATRLLRTAPHPRLVLMTDWGRMIALESEIEQVVRLGADLIMKPKHSAELDQLLVTYYARSAERSQAAADSDSARVGHLSESNLKQTLLGILGRLQRQTDAAELVVFAISPGQQHLDVLAHRGSRYRLREKELQAHWLYSPIRDALQDGEMVTANSASDPKEAARFRYLLRAFEFESCIGVPVQAETRAAVFIFHAQPNHFKRSHRQFARAAAEQVGAVLDRYAMERATAEMHRYVLLGQLGAVVVHEINNKLGSANWSAQKLPGDLRQLEAQWRSSANREGWQPLWDKIAERADTLTSAMNDLLKITQGFDTLIRRQETARLDVHEVITQAIAFSMPLAEEAQVMMRTQFHHPAPYVTGVAAWLQQGFLNTLLNAIQQIKESDRSAGGHVLVTTLAAPPGAKRGLQIRIHDDGPGIHTALWERVFDLGFTTRKHGSGIGLFMTRQLIESLGGRIAVEESHPWWGTTILIELAVWGDEEARSEADHA